jgi:hypothetical protein
VGMRLRSSPALTAGRGPRSSGRGRLTRLSLCFDTHTLVWYFVYSPRSILMHPGTPSGRYLHHAPRSGQRRARKIPAASPSPTRLSSFAGRLEPLFWHGLRRAGQPAFQGAEPSEFLGRFVLLRHAATLSRAVRPHKGSPNPQQVNLRALPLKKLSGKSELAPNRGFKSRQVETNEPKRGHLLPPGRTVGCPLGHFPDCFSRRFGE